MHDVADDPANAPVSRAGQKRKGQYNSIVPSIKKVASRTSDDVSSIIDVSSSKRKKDERKDASVATALMNTNLTIRMGQMQELKESMDFLDRMRSLIGEEEYSTRAKRLLRCLPDPATYKSDVTSKPLLLVNPAVASKPNVAENEEEEQQEEEDTY